MKNLLKIIFILLLFLFLQQRTETVFASISLNIKGSRNEIEESDEFEIETILSGAPHNTSYYLQVALTSTEKNAYFGYTQNNGYWFKYSDSYENFILINTNNEGSWSGKIKGKVDREDKDYKGRGNYLVKIGRITSSGKSHDWSDNSLAMKINGPTPTPINVPTATLKPTHVLPTNTPVKNSPTQKIQKQPTIIPTVKPTHIIKNGTNIAEDLIISNSSGKEDYRPEILGDNSDKPNISTESENITQPQMSKQKKYLFEVLMFAGLISISLGILYSIFRIRKENKKSED